MIADILKTNFLAAVVVILTIVLARLMKNQVFRKMEIYRLAGHRRFYVHTGTRIFAESCRQFVHSRNYLHRQTVSDQRICIHKQT